MQFRTKKFTNGKKKRFQRNLRTLGIGEKYSSITALLFTSCEALENALDLPEFLPLFFCTVDAVTLHLETCNDHRKQGMDGACDGAWPPMLTNTCPLYPHQPPEL